MFKHHVQKTCYHENRVLSICCILCTRKNDGAEVWVDYSNVLAHFYQSHIQLFYKCSACPKAFAEKMAIYDHREKVHTDIEVNEQVCNNYLFGTYH